MQGSQVSRVTAPLPGRPRSGVERYGNVLGHTGVGSTLSLTEATVTTITTGQVQLASSGSRVHGDGFADDEAIADELADGLAGVGIGDLADLVGIEPDLALAASDDGGREALLRAEIDPATDAIQVSLESIMKKSEFHFG